MDAAAGIDKLMLAAWCAVPGLGWVIQNSEISRYIEAFPDRFVGAAPHEPKSRPCASSIECVLASWVHCAAYRAVAVEALPNDKLYYPLFVKCRAGASCSARKTGFDPARFHM
jgi:hypothetical protein